jgi:hypothetical protein
MMMKKIRKKTKIRWMTIIIFASFLPINCGKKTTLSDDLLGIWKTSDIKYGNTFFELKRNAVVFGTKEGDVNSFPILDVKIEKIQDKDWILCTIFYETADFQKVEFPFYFCKGHSGLIRFRNQPSLVWQKTTIKP